MSDRAMAGLVMLLPTALCWGLAWSYLRDGEVSSAKTGRTITRGGAPKRFWAGVIVTALLGCITFGFFLLCLLL